MTPVLCPSFRDFAYVARDKNTRVLKCHVFRCDTPAAAIATSLHEICSKVGVVTATVRPAHLKQAIELSSNEEGEVNLFLLMQLELLFWGCNFPDTPRCMFYKANTEECKPVTVPWQGFCYLSLERPQGREALRSCTVTQDWQEIRFRLEHMQHFFKGFSMCSYVIERERERGREGGLWWQRVNPLRNMESQTLNSAKLQHKAKSLTWFSHSLPPFPPHSLSLSLTHESVVPPPPLSLSHMNQWYPPPSLSLTHESVVPPLLTLLTVQITAGLNLLTQPHAGCIVNEK